MACGELGGSRDMEGGQVDVTYWVENVGDGPSDGTAIVLRLVMPGGNRMNVGVPTGTSWQFIADGPDYTATYGGADLLPGMSTPVITWPMSTQVTGLVIDNTFPAVLQDGSGGEENFANNIATGCHTTDVTPVGSATVDLGLSVSGPPGCDDPPLPVTLKVNHQGGPSLDGTIDVSLSGWAGTWSLDPASVDQGWQQSCSGASLSVQNFGTGNSIKVIFRLDPAGSSPATASFTASCSGTSSDGSGTQLSGSTTTDVELCWSTG